MSSGAAEKLRRFLYDFSVPRLSANGHNSGANILISEQKKRYKKLC